jgi:hypothetical protein
VRNLRLSIRKHRLLPSFRAGTDVRSCLSGIASGEPPYCGRHGTFSSCSTRRSDTTTSSMSPPSAAAAGCLATWRHVDRSRWPSGKCCISVRTSASVFRVVTDGILRGCGNGRDQFGRDNAVTPSRNFNTHAKIGISLTTGKRRKCLRPNQVRLSNAPLISRSGTSSFVSIRASIDSHIGGNSSGGRYCSLRSPPIRSNTANSHTEGLYAGQSFGIAGTRYGAPLRGKHGSQRFVPDLVPKFIKKL